MAHEYIDHLMDNLWKIECSKKKTTVLLPTSCFREFS